MPVSSLPYQRPAILTISSTMQAQEREPNRTVFEDIDYTQGIHCVRMIWRWGHKVSQERGVFKHMNGQHGSATWSPDADHRGNRDGRRSEQVGLCAGGLLRASLMALTSRVLWTLQRVGAGGPPSSPLASMAG